MSEKRQVDAQRQFIDAVMDMPATAEIAALGLRVCDMVTIARYLAPVHADLRATAVRELTTLAEKWEVQAASDAAFIDRWGPDLSVGSSAIHHRNHARELRAALAEIAPQEVTP